MALNTTESMSAKAAPASEPVAAEGASEPALTRTAQAEHQNERDRMKAILDKQPKVRVRTRSDGDVFVQINGYGTIIKPDVWVHVPQQIATMLEDADYI